MTNSSPSKPSAMDGVFFGDFDNGASETVMSKIPKEAQRRVRAQARNRCGYCISSQKYILGLLEMEHIHPEALGGTDDEENLWLACRLCNGFKGIQTHGRDPITGRRVKLFNPRRQQWKRHFT